MSVTSVTEEGDLEKIKKEWLAGNRLFEPIARGVGPAIGRAGKKRAVPVAQSQLRRRPVRVGVVEAAARDGRVDRDDTGCGPSNLADAWVQG